MSLVIDRLGRGENTQSGYSAKRIAVCRDGTFLGTFEVAAITSSARWSASADFQ
jgi:hypothetical protein